MKFISRIKETKKIKRLMSKLRFFDKKYKVSKKAENIKNMATDKISKIEDVIENKLDEKISFDDFLKVEVRVGEILEAEEVLKSDKLLKLKVDLGEKETRQIVSGIKKYFKNPSELVGKQAMFVTNLAPRKIFGIESDGMIFALSDDKNFSVLSPNKKIKNGTRAS